MPSSQISEKLLGLYPVIRQQLDKLLPQVKKLREDLAAQVIVVAASLNK